MKITCLKGSPWKHGNTNSLTDIVLDSVQSHLDVETFELYDMDLKPCVDCLYCQKDWSRITCSQKDDMMQIFQSIDQSDLVLLATPIYAWYCTAPMKCVLDRMAYVSCMYYGDEIGPALWEGKSLALITTSGYQKEKGPDLLEAGVQRACKHLKMRYVGMLWERQRRLKDVFMDDEKARHAEKFAEMLTEYLYGQSQEVR